MADEQLTVSLGLENSPFLHGLEKSKAAAKAFGGAINDSMSILKGGALGAAVFTGARALHEWANEARRVIYTAESLDVSVAFYAKLGNVFKQLGEDAQTGDKALQKFAETMAGAKRGNEADIAPFKKLGLEEQLPMWETAEDAIEAVKEAFDAMGPSVERTAVAVDLFGKRASAMLAALRTMPKMDIADKMVALEEQKRLVWLDLWAEGFTKRLKLLAAASFQGLNRFFGGSGQSLEEGLASAGAELEEQEALARATAKQVEQERVAGEHMKEQDKLLEAAKVAKEAENTLFEAQATIAEKQVRLEGELRDIIAERGRSTQPLENARKEKEYAEKIVALEKLRGEIKAKADAHELARQNARSSFASALAAQESALGERSKMTLGELSALGDDGTVLTRAARRRKDEAKNVEDLEWLATESRLQGNPEEALRLTELANKSRRALGDVLVGSEADPMKQFIEATNGAFEAMEWLGEAGAGEGIVVRPVMGQ